MRRFKESLTEEDYESKLEFNEDEPRYYVELYVTDDSGCEINTGSMYAHSLSEIFKKVNRYYHTDLDPDYWDRGVDEDNFGDLYTQGSYREDLVTVHLVIQKQLFIGELPHIE